MRCYVVLIDTVGIQQYVFGSNKLKENLGASYLVSDVYDKKLKDALKTLFKDEFDEDAINLWKTKPEYIAMKNGRSFEVAYIGGGNAMIFFKEQSMAEKFVREWTRLLLVETPGLNVAVAIGSFDTDSFDTSKKELFKTLARSKYQYFHLTIIPRHGITAECAHSGYSMDVYCHPEGKYVSSVINAKIEASSKAKIRINDLFKDDLGADYCFTDEIGKLGQQENVDSHIAIVHIDGNNMGDRFASQGSLDRLRELSISVHHATINSVKAMIKAIKDNKEMLLRFLEKKFFNMDGSKEILPFRPIIIGGDDITFVSEGRLGIWLAEQFLLALENQKASDNKPLSACAGVAITKSKYPFYRGYSISEQLCKNAKKKRKLRGSNGSWIDFHIAFGGITGSIDHIRDTQYKVVQGTLLMRPYCLGSFNAEDNFEVLKLCTKTLAKLPNNKIKKMRHILTLGKEQTTMFVKEMKARGDGNKIPEIEGKNFRESLFENSVTPYFDMIELMEFYPGLKEA